MSALHTVLAKFENPKKTGDQYLVRCPVHADRVASLAIREGEDGKVLLHCHAGCDTDDILRTIGLEDVDLFDDGRLSAAVNFPDVAELDAAMASKATTAKPNIIEVYDYPDEAGVLLFQVVRTEPKDFRQRRPDGKGGYLWNLTDTRRVLYRLPDLKGKAGVVVAEGEKDVNKLWELGIPATTNVGGAGKWTADYTKQLVAQGVRRVVIVPDNDVPGRNHANEVALSLVNAGITVRMGILPDVPPKGDISDYLSTHSKNNLLDFLKAAPPWSPEVTAPPPVQEPLTTFRHSEDRQYIWAVVPPGVQFELNNCRRDHHELCGELTVRTDITGTSKTQGGALMTAEFNLSSARARAERAKLLSVRAKTGNDVDWFAMLEEFCERVFEAERTGSPAIRLDEGEPVLTQTDDFIRIDGLMMLLKHPQILFGDGGTAKSYLALYLAGRLAQLGHRVLYADWELLPEEHKVRLFKMFGPDRPELWYLACERPLVTEQERIRKTIKANSLDYMFVDSVAVACDGPPEAAEVTTAYYRALRSLGIGSTSIAHTNKSETSDRKPFGSSFWHNLARATYFAQRSEENEDAKQLTVGVFNRKANLGPLLPATGFTFKFDENRTEVLGHVDIRDAQEFAANLPLWQRIQTVIETEGPSTLVAIAAVLDAKVQTIERTVRRRPKVFDRTMLADGIARVALIRGPRRA